jgi:SecD/SecF fusion protein
MVPAYATASHGVTVEPRGPERPGRRVTAPDDPERGVSKREFDEMVRDISHETEPSPVQTRTEPEEDPAADAAPEDLVLKEPKRDKPKRARNKRHGRPR